MDRIMDNMLTFARCLKLCNLCIDALPDDGSLQPKQGACARRALLMLGHHSLLQILSYVMIKL
jgi:hypothetical protein